MPRAPTTTDAFNAIAEPRRREIIDLLAREPGRPQAVNELVERLGIPQPAVSKHLGVLRKVGLVTADKDGQRRLYRLNAAELKPVHEWVKSFERFWGHHIDRIRERAERKAAQRSLREQAGRESQQPQKQQHHPKREDHP
jgi:DNA-binding transcriptional ArsR family regulator